jgi:hypothetical protein
MKSYLCAFLLLSAGVTVSVPQAMAQEAAKTTKKTTAQAATKKPAKKTTAKKGAAAAGAGAAAAAAAHDPDDDIKPDITGSTSVDYHCELGNKVTIYENQTDSQHVALRLNNKDPHRLKRVSTTTGASRFENKKHGLVWIGIPAKGILLDSKKGQQLANECKTLAQMAKKDTPAAQTANAATLNTGSGTPVETGSSNP